MPNVKATADEIDKVLADERRECMWDGGSFANSSYVYISKAGLKEITKLIQELRDVADYYVKLEEEEKAVRRKLAACNEELIHISEDNDGLRKQGKEMLALMLQRDARVEQLFKMLKELRGVFDGQGVSMDQMKALLARTDEVLGGGA